MIGKLWQRFDNETLEEYGAFVAFRESSEPLTRNLVDFCQQNPGAFRAAQKHFWLERVVAYDTYQLGVRMSALFPLVGGTAAELSQVLKIQVRRLKERQLADPDSITDAMMIKIFNSLKDLDKTVRKYEEIAKLSEGPSEVDFAKLSPEQQINLRLLMLAAGADG